MVIRQEKTRRLLCVLSLRVGGPAEADVDEVS
jgi:hypothetical protein